MAIKQKRDKGLKIMMTETTFARLNHLGELLGQSPSTLASIAVSNLVNDYMGKTDLQDRAINAMAAHAGPAFAEQIKLLGGAA